MLTSEFVQYPEGPREKNHATQVVEAILKKLASDDVFWSPQANLVTRFDPLLQEWILELNSSDKKETYNLSMILQHANLSHITLTDWCIRQLNQYYVHHKITDDFEPTEPENLTHWPDVFFCMPSPLRMALRLYTSQFGKIANRFVRGESLKKNKDYSPIMIFVTTCLINIALNRIPTYPVDIKRHKKRRARGIEFVWRYEFNKEITDYNQFHQQQCRSQPFPLPHVLSTSREQSENSNVLIENVPSHSACVSSISYYDEQEFALPAGTLLQFKRESKDLLRGRIFNSYCFDRDFYFTAIAFRYTYEHFLSKKFKETDETIQIGEEFIARPNHGLVHNLLVVIHFSWVLSIYCEFAYQLNFEKICRELSNIVQEKLRVVLLFLITGRESEVSFFQDTPTYLEFKKRSRANFLAFAHSCELFKEENELLSHDLSVNEYADLILYYSDEKYLDNLPNQDSEFILYCRIISFAHDLHLARCYSKEEYEQTLTRHWKHLSIPHAHSTIVALKKAVIAMIDCTGDDLYSKRGYRQPFNIFSNSVRKCDELLRRAPLNVPTANELEDFLEYIKTEKAMKKTRMPNLLNGIDENKSLTLLKIVTKDFLQIVKHPLFLNCHETLADELEIILNQEPGLLPELMQLEKVESVFYSSLKVKGLVLEKIPAALPYILTALKTEDLKNYKGRLLNVLKLSPAIHEELIINWNLISVFTKETLPGEGELLVKSGALSTMLKCPSFIAYLNNNKAAFSLYLVPPYDILKVTQWQGLITNPVDLLIVLKNCIESHLVLLSDPNIIALINRVETISAVLDATFAYTRLLFIPEIKQQISDATEFYLIMNKAADDICLYVAIQYEYWNYVKNLTDWIRIYSGLPGLRAHLLERIDPLTLASSLNEQMRLAHDFPPIFNNEKFITSINSYLDLLGILENNIFDCTHWLNYPNIVELLEHPKVILAFLSNSQGSFDWIYKNKNFPRKGPATDWYTFMMMFPNNIPDFIESPILIESVVCEKDLTLILNCIASPHYVQLFMDALIKSAKNLKELITAKSVESLIEIAPDYFQKLMVTEKCRELLAQCFADKKCLSVILNHTEILRCLWLQLPEKIQRALPIKSRALIFYKLPDLCLDWLKTKNITSRFASMLMSDEDLAFQLTPYFLEHPDIFTVRSAGLNPHLFWLLSQQLITEEFNNKNDIASLTEADLTRYFCFSRDAQTKLLPYLFVVQDAFWRVRIVESVQVHDRELVGRHFGKPCPQTYSAKNKVHSFFDKRKNVMPAEQYDQLRNYRKYFNEISLFIEKLKKGEDVDPTTQQLQIIKKNLVYIGMILSCEKVNEDLRDELILSLDHLCKDKDLLLKFWQAFPDAFENSLGRQYPAVT